MNQSSTPKLDVKINRFAKSLKKALAPEITKDPGAFRATVLGKLKPRLPRRRPGRQGGPEVICTLQKVVPATGMNWPNV
jgi:hypothetical protein